MGHGLMEHVHPLLAHYYGVIIGYLKDFQGNLYHGRTNFLMLSLTKFSHDFKLLQCKLEGQLFAKFQYG